MTKFLKNKVERVQLLLVILVWLLLFAIPILFGESSNFINWPHIFKIWKEYIMLFFIFLANHFLLMPQLFLKGRRTYYFISLLGIIILFSFAVYFFSNISDQEHMPTPRSEHVQAPRPDNILPPRSGNEPPRGPGNIQQHPFDRPREFIPAYANLFIMCILLIGFDSGLLFFSKWMQSEQNKLKAESESIANKMAFLKNQISPHFFMNTLNNIHALVDINTEEAKDAIIKLSQMMDYMLYESQTQGVSLKQELDFTSSYVELMKLRITDEVDLQLEIPEILPPVKIPPLLTISFIENAFKYGISYQRPSFVHIHINIYENQFIFKVENRIHQEIKQNKNSGIGIENTRKRLELLFGNNYMLNIDKKDEIFKVNLVIPI